MRKFYLAGISALLLLGSCGESSNSDALSGSLTDAEDIQEAAKSFGEGGATNGEEYFSGILAEVVDVDVKFREVEEMDEIDAPQADFKRVLDGAIERIDEGRKALNLYKDENWPKRAEFHDLTFEWFDSMEGLINNYLYDLAEPMSRPDDTWTDEDFDLYDEYSVALDEFYEVDERWIDFQYVYADANGFMISGTIDEDAMVEENMSAMEEEH